MEMSSTRTVPASINATWNALNDPAFLKECIPGCESIERLSDAEYKVVMATKVGPVSARFTGKMTLSDLEPPRAYSLAFEGQGGAAGFAKGGARVELAASADGASTDMSYRVNAQVGGKLAQIGSRLVDGAAKKVADDFFIAFVEKLGAAQAPSGPPEGIEATAAEAVTGAEVGAPAGASPAGEVVSGPERKPPSGLSRNKVVTWAVLIIAALVLWLISRR